MHNGRASGRANKICIFCDESFINRSDFLKHTNECKLKSHSYTIKFQKIVLENQKKEIVRLNEVIKENNNSHYKK